MGLLPGGMRRVRRRWACNLLVSVSTFLLLAHYAAKQHTSIMTALELSLQRAQEIQVQQLHNAVEVSKKRRYTPCDRTEAQSLIDKEPSQRELHASASG